VIWSSLWESFLMRKASLSSYDEQSLPLRIYPLPEFYQSRSPT
jgi:hypothetical protein